MSNTKMKSHVISIRVSDAEKRQLDAIAQKRKRRSSSLVKSYVLEGLKQKNTSKQEKLQAFYDFQERFKESDVLVRDPEQVVDDIRKFRGDE